MHKVLNIVNTLQHAKLEKLAANQRANEMKTTNDYIEEAKKKLGMESDNALALYLEITRGAMSHYRKGRSTMDVFTATKIAEILDIDPMTVIAAAQLERETNEKKRKYWENFSKRISGIAAAVLITATMAYDIDLTSNMQFNEYTLCALKQIRTKRQSIDDLSILDADETMSDCPSKLRSA